MTQCLDIEIQRNADYQRVWTFADSEGAPIDLTGATFDMKVKYAAGEDDPITVFTVTPTDLSQGEVTITLAGDAFDAVPGVKERIELAWDLVATQGGIKMAVARGALILIPGVS